MVRQWEYVFILPCRVVSSVVLMLDWRQSRWHFLQTHGHSTETRRCRLLAFFVGRSEPKVLRPSSHPPLSLVCPWVRRGTGIMDPTRTRDSPQGVQDPVDPWIHSPRPFFFLSSPPRPLDALFSPQKSPESLFLLVAVYPFSSTYEVQQPPVIKWMMNPIPQAFSSSLCCMCICDFLCVSTC